MFRNIFMYVCRYMHKIPINEKKPRIWTATMGRGYMGKVWKREICNSIKASYLQPSMFSEVQWLSCKTEVKCERYVLWYESQHLVTSIFNHRIIAVCLFCICTHIAITCSWRSEVNTGNQPSPFHYCSSIVKLGCNYPLLIEQSWLHIIITIYSLHISAVAPCLFSFQLYSPSLFSLCPFPSPLTGEDLLPFWPPLFSL